VEATVEQTKLPYDLAIWTDGGCRPNPGHGGVGIHGYFYKQKESKTGNGHPTHILTNEGYILKADYKQIEKSKFRSIAEIEVVSYIDVVAANPNSSNNRAELLALTIGLEKAVQYGVLSLTCYLDSQYTIDRYNSIEKGKANNWTSNGEKVKNWDLLERLYQAHIKAKEAEFKVSIKKVAGHSGEPGNEAADQLASIGVALTANGEAAFECVISDAKGYWKSDVERHPFLQSQCCYFHTNPNDIKSGTYLLGSHGKKSELLGTRMTEGSYAIVQIDEGVDVLESVRDTAVNKSDYFGRHCLMFANLDKIFNPNVFSLITTYKDRVMLQKPKEQDLYLLSTRSDRMFVEALEPPRLAWRAMDALNYLNSIYQDVERKSGKVVVTDITHYFYESIEKAGKGKNSEPILLTQLKKEFVVGYRNLDVDAHCKYEDNEYKLTTRLILGVDMPNRNSLKRLEGLNPTIELVTWPESETSFRYAVIIRVDGARGIWAGYYSNFLFVPKKK